MPDPEVQVLQIGLPGPASPPALSEENLGTVAGTGTVTPTHATKTHGRVVLTTATALTVALGTGGHLLPRDYTLFVWASSAATPLNFTVTFSGNGLGPKVYTIPRVATGYFVFVCRFSPNQNAWTIEKASPIIEPSASPVTYESLGTAGAGASSIQINVQTADKGNLVVTAAGAVMTIAKLTGSPDPSPFRYLISIDFVLASRKVGSSMTLDIGWGPFNFGYDPDNTNKINFTGVTNWALVEIFFDGGNMRMVKISDP